MKEFKILLVGCGGMSQAWVKYAIAREDCKIVGLVDIFEENAKKLATLFDLNCPVFVDLVEAIQGTDANLVFDVTIPESHYKVATFAMQSGLDVLSEKPLAASLEQAIEMVATAKDNGRSYFIMQNRRYLKNIRAFQDVIKSGVIGETGFLCADFFLGPHFGGFRDIMDSPLILDMAIHTFDQARFLLGKDPVSVYCQEFNPPGSWYAGAASAVCIFEFANGSVFCYRGSWCAEGLNTSWESEWRATGSRGTAIWNGSDMPYYEQVHSENKDDSSTQKGKVISTFEWDGQEGHIGCFDEMFSALKEGRKAETTCEDNIKSMEMVFAAIESSRTGKKVKLKNL